MKRKLLSLLVLLLMAATGAVAQTETLLTTITGAGSNTSLATSANVSYSTEGVATLTFSEPTSDGQVAYNVSPAWGWWGYAITLTVTPAEGYTITKCIFYDNDNHTATDSEAPFVVETVFDDKTPKVNGTILAYTSKGIKKIEVYGYAPFNVTANEGASGEYWATFYSNASNFKAPEGTQVFKVALAGSAITMTEITDRIVKKGQGVVLKKTASGSITMTPTSSNSSDDYSGNSLVGTMTNITNPGNAYVLNYKAATGAGFYKLGASGIIGANKAYLTYSSGSLAPKFFGFDGNTTSINEVRGKMEDVSGEYYDLQGRRVANPTKSLYIVNGKKVFINK